MRAHAVMAKPSVAAAFDPLSISGCKLWLDANDAATFTYSSGVVVSQWNDKSGTGNHVSQGTTAQQPSRSGTIGGVTTVTFDGGDYLTGALVLTLAAHTVFVVWQELAAVSYAGVLSLTTVGGTDYNSLGNLSLNDGSTTHLYNWDAPAIGIGDGGGSGLAPAAQWTTASGGGSSYMWRDGAAEANTAAVVGSSCSGTLLGARWIAGSANLTYGLNGKIGEVIIYDTKLSDGDRETVEDYLSTKWGTP